MVEDIRDYGAAVDGSTDDTAAIADAIAAAAPDGTVYFPAGTIRFGAGTRLPIRLTEQHANLTLAGAGPGSTELLMAGGHTKAHFGVRISPSDGAAVSDLTIRDLRLDGQGMAQDYRIGIGIGVDFSSTAQAVTVQNVAVENWAMNGMNVKAPGAQIADSTFHHNGHKAEAAAGYHGHGIDANTGNGGLVIERALCTDNTGNGVNNNGGSVTLRDSVIRDNEYAIKLDERTTGFRVSNTRFANHGMTVFHNEPQDTDNGDLVLNKVRIEDAGWPAFLLPAGGTFKGDDIVIVRTNTKEDQPAAVVVKDEGRSFDVGSMSVHDTAGSALSLQNSSGSIDRLVHDGNSDGVGDAGGVSIGSVERGDPLTISVPTAQDVGAGKSSSDDGSSGDLTDDSTDDSPSYGGYSTPEQGSLDWHEPLNDNFDSIEADILDLARRIEQLEN